MAYQATTLEKEFLKTDGIDMQQLYWQALFLSFKKFIDAEQQRHLNSVDQFVLNVNAAKQLYKR